MAVPPARPSPSASAPHDHAHGGGHDHAHGHSHAPSEAGHAHAGHAHAGHSHPGHLHEGHSHGGHSHGGHSHGGHSHGGHHHHGPASYDRAFALAAALNLGFVLAEMAAGVLANSVALVADAVHNLGDVLSLLLGWGAAWLSRRPPSARRTYGWGRSSILASLANAVVLLVSVGAIGIEAVQRLAAPQPVASLTVMIVAAAGIVVNGGTALLFMRGRENDLNIRAQFLHLGGDAAISAGVVVAAGLIALTGQAWIDPAASLAVAILILVSTWGLLRESVDLAMDAVPVAVERESVRGFLAAQPGITEVHDLHIWALSTTETALTAHLVCDGPEGTNLHDLTTALHRRFGIGHATLQIETGADAALCRLRPDDVI